MSFKTYGAFTFDYEYDKGGDLENPHIIYVKEKSNPSKVLGSRVFKRNATEQHMDNFMKKIANDSDYRKKWNISVSAEQKLKDDNEKLEKSNVALSNACDVYLTTILKNSELRDMFVRELKQSEVSKYQEKQKKAILELIKEEEINENLR